MCDDNNNCELKCVELFFYNNNDNNN